LSETSNSASNYVFSPPTKTNDNSYQATVVAPEEKLMKHQKYIDNMIKNLADKD
jgi:hypothetical protein